MRTRFYLIRHGETDWNKQGIYQGWTDIELSQEGKRQADLLAKRFVHISLDAIYVSPLKRAIATAEPIAAVKGIPVQLDEHFKEINFGEWEGSSVPQLKEKYGEPFTKFFDDPFAHPFPGEGSFEKVRERSVKGFEELLQRHKGQSVGIVSHGGLLRVLIMTVMVMDNSFYRKTWLNNTSITVIDVMEDGQKLLLTLNDKAHLEWTQP
ncbi:MAG: histidine phosphatase family protein [Epulopiscium sp.]|jgi:broad specificity phosphatase PhoE|nr:histidine phosphatase family protein [Candidatus Epulonipiscium sp.]